MSADNLSRAVDLLVRQVDHWEAPRWAVRTTTGEARAELVHGLVQRIADLASDSEKEPRRPVPRLDNDLALPDQLRVVAADLLATGAAEAVLAAAADDVTAVRHAL